MTYDRIIFCNVVIFCICYKFEWNFYRLPQLVDSKNKLVQLGSGNSTPDLTKTVSPSGSSLSKSPSILPDYPERYAVFSYRLTLILRKYQWDITVLILLHLNYLLGSMIDQRLPKCFHRRRNQKISQLFKISISLPLAAR